MFEKECNENEAHILAIQAESGAVTQQQAATSKFEEEKQKGYSVQNYSGRTDRTNLKKINSQQKHALRIIFNKSKFEHTSELLKSSKILNVYKQHFQCCSFYA